MSAPAGFEWDEKKAASNAMKHGVRFEAAIRVFEDPRFLLSDATRAQDGEVRFKAVGEVDGRLHTVVHTWRGDVVRIISARRAKTSEVRKYDRSLHI